MLANLALLSEMTSKADEEAKRAYRYNSHFGPSTITLLEVQFRL